MFRYYLKKADKGLIFIQESLKQNHKDYIALNTLGLIYMAMEMYDEANKIFKQSIKTNPNYVPNYNNLGRCYSLQNDRESALLFFKKACSSNLLQLSKGRMKGVFFHRIPCKLEICDPRSHFIRKVSVWSSA